jgi:DnaK suppressor protein
VNTQVLAELKKVLERREKQLISEIEAGRERASREPFGQVASEVPDAGDASVAALAVDMMSADRLRDADELHQVREALSRIESGSYGLCQECGEPIPVERLRASPAARYDIRHQQAREDVSTPTL